jgi:integrase
MSQAGSQDRASRAGQRFERHKTKHRGISFRENANGRSYYVFWGSKYLSAGKTLQEALALQSNLRSRKSRGERVVVASKRTVREVGEAWFAAERSNWREGYASDLRRNLDREVYAEFGDDLVASLGPREIIEFDRKLRARGLSESGVANIAKPLRGLLDHGVLCGDISVSPYRQVPKGKLASCNTRRQHHEWTTEEVERFIATAYKFDERETAQRSYGLQVELMVRLGFRIAEVTGLRFSDIDRDAKVVHVRRQWTKHNRLADYTKTQAGPRRVPLTDELLAKLDFRQQFLALTDGDFVFAEKVDGTPPTHNNFRRRAWNSIVAATGLQLEPGVKITPHSARHAAASQLAASGLDEEDGASLLGHTSGRVTRGIYVHSFDRDRKEARIRDAIERARTA